MLLLALSAGILGGVVAGALTSRRVLRHARWTSVDQSSTDPDVRDRIDQAAAQWAEANHQPAAAPLVANKLRLAYVLHQRQRRRRDRRWSR